MLCAPPPASLLFFRLSGSAATEQALSWLHLFRSTQVSPISHIASTIILRFLALLRLSSALPNPVSRLPSLGSGPQQDATVSLRRRVLRPWLLVIRWRRPPTRFFRPTSVTTLYLSRLSLLSTLISVLVPILSPLPAPVAASVLAPIPTLVLIPVLALPPVPVSVPLPATIFSLPFLVPCSPLSNTSSGRRRVLRPKLLATCRHHLLST